VAPLGDVGAVEAFTAQERPALGLWELVVADQRLCLVPGRELLPTCLGWDLRLRVRTLPRAFPSASIECAMVSVAIVGSTVPAL